MGNKGSSRDFPLFGVNSGILERPQNVRIFLRDARKPVLP